MRQHSPSITAELDRAPVWQPDDPAPGDVGQDGGPPSWPAPLDLRSLARREPEPPRFVIPDWMPTGYATLLAGHGGAGKSYIALHQAVCIAAGLPWWGLPTEQRRVVYLSCEDREDVLHWRLSRICAHLGIDMADLDGRLQVIDLVGHETILWTGANDAVTAYETLRQRVRGNEVIYIDGVNDTFGGSENSRAEVKAFVNSLLGLIRADEGAVVLIGHVNKPTASAGGTSEGYSGTTGWHNAVRARMYLHHETQADPDEGGQPERTGRLILELQKSNLGRADQSIAFVWDDTAHLFVADGGTAGEHWIDRQARERRAEDVFLRLLDQSAAEGRPVSPKPRAGNFAPKALAKKPDRDGLTKRDLEQAMERLFEAGTIVVGHYRDARRRDLECIVRADA